jgi:hypothetical protein
MKGGHKHVGTVPQDGSVRNLYASLFPTSADLSHMMEGSPGPSHSGFFPIGITYGNNRNYLDYFYLPCFKLAVRSLKTVPLSQKTLHGIFSSIASLR